MTIVLVNCRVLFEYKLAWDNMAEVGFLFVGSKNPCLVASANYVTEREKNSYTDE